MLKPIEIRGLRIGEGMPKVIVPLAGATQAEILAKAAEYDGLPIDMVEWRADYFQGLGDKAALSAALRALREALEGMPLLFTIRTAPEGGQVELSGGEYTAINCAVAASGMVDLIDVQMFMQPETVAANIAGIHGQNVLVMGSYHDFRGTPDRAELLRRLRSMQERGADILKLAVMPQCPEDVLTLISATGEMHEKYADRPIIAVSMSKLGAISRLTGEQFGSAMTFGMVGQASAPGQIPLQELRRALEILHRAI